MARHKPIGTPLDTAAQGSDAPPSASALPALKPVEFAKPPKRKKSKLFRAIRSLIVLCGLGVVVIGPWPADNSTYVGSAYQQATLARIDQLGVTPTNATPLRMGLAEINITPRIGHTLAGYSKQDVKQCTGVFSDIFARALTLEASGKTITILTADLLFIHPAMAAEVIKRTGLRAEDIYFTASHTHTGPGEWAPEWIEHFSVGSFDEAYFDELAQQLADAITQSREQLAPAEIAVAVAHAPSLMRSRIDTMNETDDRISAILFRNAGASDAPPRAILVSYAAHPTAAGRDDPRISPDYPGGIADRLKQLTGAEYVLFAAGAVGDASPVPPNGVTGCESAHDMGVKLADALVMPIARARYRSDVPMSCARLAVDLPALRVPITENTRVSSVITAWFDRSQTHMSVLRLGPVLMVGMPCDFAGAAAKPLIEWAESNRMLAITTSFNGDYHGYFMSLEEFHQCPKLEQRGTYLRGPWAGAYFADLAMRVGSRMTGDILTQHSQDE